MLFYLRLRNRGNNYELCVICRGLFYIQISPRGKQWNTKPSHYKISHLCFESDSFHTWGRGSELHNICSGGDYTTECFGGFPSSSDEILVLHHSLQLSFIDTYILFFCLHDLRFRLSFYYVNVTLTFTRCITFSKRGLGEPSYGSITIKFVTQEKSL